MRKYLIDGNNEVFKEDIVFDKVSAESDSLEKVVPIFKTNEIVEAEAGYLGSSHVGSDISGTQGSYVRTGGGLLRYQFRVERDGVYRLRARLVTPSGNNNSIYVTMNDEKWQTWSMSKSNSWKWQEFPFEWNLKPGLHLLTFENREQIWIDQIELEEVKK
jgi:hypothetical protein